MRRKQDPFARIEAMPDGRFSWHTSFDETAKEAMKSEVPYFYRQWDNQNKRWIVEPQYHATLARLSERYFNVRIAPMTPAARVIPQTERTVRLLYIGGPKYEAGERYCSGLRLDQRFYDVIFLGNVLRQWFQGNGAAVSDPSDEMSWYELLGVKHTATPDEIKKGFRVASMTWHPDKNPNDKEAAAEMFIMIKDAYDNLKDPQIRARYDVFLNLESKAKRSSNRRSRYDNLFDSASKWRPPIRCGEVRVTCRMFGYYHVVDQILDWQDITDRQGRVMVSEYDMAQNAPRVSWV